MIRALLTLCYFTMCSTQVVQPNLPKFVSPD